MRCASCGHENRDEAKFCEECAVPLQQVCAGCGAARRPTAKFCDECGQSATASPAQRPIPSPASYTPKHLADKILTSRAALEGERKTITALFADIKGSMELIEGLDPEEARHVIDPALQVMMDAVHRYEGYVAQSTGDGIFALFGAPIAHEDHPQRALYAALLMQDEIEKYGDRLQREKGLRLHIRVGVNTGAVVVRSIRKDDLHTDYVPVGHSTSLAARMESLAKPGTIVVSEDTHRLTEGYFQFRDLGPAKVKGVSEPVNIYEVSGVGPLRTRLQVATRRGLTRFVGRRDEMDQMKRAFEQARGGHGQIVAVMGEPGVGKSRLVYEFKVPLQAKCLVLESFSVSHGKAHAFLPLIELLKDYFRIRLGDDERKRREKVTGKALTLDRALEDILPYLFALLGISEAPSSLAQMDPPIRRQRTLDAVKRLLVRESLNQPLVLIFEDLHWIDGETQAFLDLLAESIATARTLLLVNYRPEYRHGWGSKTYYTQLRLDPLGREEAEELLGALLGNGTRAALEPIKRLVQLIMEKTEGNPFFMEEVVQTLAEERVLTGERGGYRLERPPTELHIPTTVQGVLAARIDRLAAEEKDLLQTLAVVGKEFPAGLARKVADKSEEGLHGLLAHLQAAEFIYEQPAFPEPEYTFKHALTQEVAYQSVLVERRKLMHERTAQAIEEIYHDGLDEHYAELAHHYGRTDNTAKAVEYLHLAGQQALKRSAYEEAINQLNRGVELLGKLPESRERNQAELLLQTTLGPALIATTGWSSAEAENAFTRASDLCQQLGDDAQLAIVLWGLATLYATRAELHKARELGERMMSLAEKAQELTLLLAAHETLGYALQYSGEAEAATHLDEAIRLYDPNKHRWLASVFAVDLGVTGRAYKGEHLLLAGFPDQALAMSREGLRLAAELSHPFSLATAMVYTCVILWGRGDYQEAKEMADSLATFSEEHGFPQYSITAALLQGMVLTHLGKPEHGISRMRQALDALLAAGSRLGMPIFLAFTAEARGTLGESEAGLQLIADAMKLVNETGERVYEAYVYRVKGDLLLTSSAENDAKAEQCFHEAIDVACRQKAKSLELEAATSLARLWQKQGKQEEAHRMLSEIYGWFTEGFETRDLKEAKALLDELSQER
jgi:class 3 adenylate cyclase/predicted ATPase